MKKLLNTGYSATTFNLALFILRVGAGILMVHHGYDKLVKFDEYAPNFMHFLGLSGSLSLALVIFSEFFCAIFVMLGLFTRLFFIIYFTILIIGPGKVSVDGMIHK
jgi:putative oxidoreductase